MKEPEELWKIQYPDGSFSIKTWHSEKKLSMHVINNAHDYIKPPNSKADAVCFSLEERKRVGIGDVLKDALNRKGKRSNEIKLRLAKLQVEEKERELQEAQRRLEDAQSKS